ncbi:YdeI/OmpD-associated family protein [Paenibacillus sp. MWE-103]|uniref:YdeI/OmpD-associated family protein n=1 Tax=Paenibacillus artemisiicola TaxID=1172618 RepID=A0ABS3W2Y5_9BACL|nr:YdeI/OmpD-associated family protein [Paenibacillus artemisiicola]MBO7742653.1 YdeI/OmpD-associated family protein [Paenibacillus artemisiicola]
MEERFKELPVLGFADTAELEDWLAEHHATSSGFWLLIAKKGSGEASVTYGEALEAALCYGWIDSQKEKRDASHWIQRFTPRGPRSIWSKVNKEKAERLIEEDRMKPAGLRAIEAAKRGGEWDKAYASQSSAEVPADFAEALAGSPKAKAFFDALDRQNRYAMTFRIHGAKKPENRAKRIAQFVEMLEKGEKIYN